MASTKSFPLLDLPDDLVDKVTNVDQTKKDKIAKHMVTSILDIEFIRKIDTQILSFVADHYRDLDKNNVKNSITQTIHNIFPTYLTLVEIYPYLLIYDIRLRNSPSYLRVYVGDRVRATVRFELYNRDSNNIETKIEYDITYERNKNGEYEYLLSSLNIHRQGPGTSDITMIMYLWLNLSTYKILTYNVKLNDLNQSEFIMYTGIDTKYKLTPWYQYFVDFTKQPKRDYQVEVNWFKKPEHNKFIFTDIDQYIKKRNILHKQVLASQRKRQEDLDRDESLKKERMRDVNRAYVHLKPSYSNGPTRSLTSNQTIFKISNVLQFLNSHLT